MRARAFTLKGDCALRSQRTLSALENKHPQRIPAMPKTLEKVRLTKRFGYFEIQGSVVTPQNSKYASSMRTAALGAASRTCCRLSRPVPPPVGLLGFEMKIARVSGRMAAIRASVGNAKLSSR